MKDTEDESPGTSCGREQEARDGSVGNRGPRDPFAASSETVTDRTKRHVFQIDNGNSTNNSCTLHENRCKILFSLESEIGDSAWFLLVVRGSCRRLRHTLGDDVTSTTKYNSQEFQRSAALREAELRTAVFKKEMEERLDRK